MIFVTAKTEPTVFLMLTEADVQTMRDGRTVFVDGRMTGGAAFDKVILSLHKTKQDALETLRLAGHTVPQLADPKPGPGETACNGCGGLIATPSLFEGRCTVCRATLAKKLMTQSN